MSKIKVIVEIEKRTYDLLKEKPDNIAERIIANGIPLPKGHGDLIDRDELSPKIHGAKSIVAVLEAPAIIEAEKEADNE